MTNKYQEIIRRVKSLVNMMPFGMKGANDKIMSSDSDALANSMTIEQKAQSQSVLHDLLNGEETESVKELRYCMYKIDRKAQEYQNNRNTKYTPRLQTGDSRKFSQMCKPICDGLSDAIRKVSNGIEMPQEYNLFISYGDFVKFKLERYAKYIDVVYNGKNDAATTLRFYTVPDINDQTSVAFVNEMRKLKDAFDKGDAKELERLSFATTVLTMNFTTYKASNNEPDLVSYMFMRPTLSDVKVYNDEYYLTYTWKECHRLDLTEKYFNENMANKYAVKAKKDYAPSIAEKLSEMANTSQAVHGIKSDNGGQKED